MTRARWNLAVLIIVLLLGSSLPALAQGAVNVAIDDLKMEAFPQAEVMVTVRDQNGVPIVGLGRDKFELVEDGRSSFPPSEVRAQVNADAGISVVMVIDISGSMKGKPIEEATRAANALLDQLSGQDRAAIIAFADEIRDLDPTVLEEGKEVGFTTDKNAIRNIVNFLNTKIGWDTPLYDAVYKGVKMVALEPAGKRAVIVMTDGRDERDNANGVPVKDAGSLSTPDDPINEANRHNIPIFSIGLGEGGKIDTKYLQRLAERTGAVYQQAPEPEELTPLFENVVNQLKTQYVLDYESRTPEDDNFHSLMVRVNLPQGQDFDELKFQVPSASLGTGPGAEPQAAEAAEASATEEGQAVAAVSGGASSGASSESEPAPVMQPTPEPESTGIEGIVDTVRDTIEDRPMLAVVIVAGVLLLLLLLIALLVVLFRGRKTTGQEAYTQVDFDEPYRPPQPAAGAGGAAWTSGPTDAGMMPPPIEDKTEVAPGGWQAAPAAEGAPPMAQAGGPPHAIPEAGSTRIIERGPKHLAMLVDKAHPDRKYDLKGTTNVGRSPDNQLVLDEVTVSRHHAWIKSEGEEFVVFDVGSANGTFVNGEQIEAPRHLENGDAVRFGDAEFVFTKVF